MNLGKLPSYLKNEIYCVPTRLLAAIWLGVLLLIPFFSDHPYLLRILIMICIFSIYAASWDLIGAYTGQSVLGHALFFGVGAYTSAILNTKLGWTPLITIPLGSIVAVGTGLIAGFPALRIKGIYLGLTTLAMPVVLLGVIETFRDLTGGEQGLVGVQPLVVNRVAFYYISLAILLVSIAILVKLTRSKYGLIFQAIRDDEIAARASGVNTTYYKLLSFCVSGLFAGLSGGLYVHFMRVIGPSVLSFTFSFDPIIWTIFGGGASIIGPVLGVFILLPLVEVLYAYIGTNATIIHYLILVVAVLYAPGGVLRLITKQLEKNCPRCFAVNSFRRRQCRVCSTQLSAEDVLDKASSSSVKDIRA